MASVVFRPDGQMLAPGSNDNTVILWNVSDQTIPVQLAPSLAGHIWFVSSHAFSPDGKTLASGSYDSMVILWDVSDPAAPTQLTQHLVGHTGEVLSFAYSPDGKRLVSAGSDTNVFFWGVGVEPSPLPAFIATLEIKGKLGIAGSKATGNTQFSDTIYHYASHTHRNLPCALLRM